jgi:hypothetical protein
MEAAWVDRLERRLGFLAMPGLPGFLCGMTIAVGLLGSFKPEFVSALILDPAALRAGQFWRALTFVVVPPPGGALWLALWILMQYSILSALETAWGDFKITFFLLLGVLATTGAAAATGGLFGNSYVMLAAFLAFARLLPDREVLVMFVLPVKLRWLAALTGMWLGLGLVVGGLLERAEILSGLLPYLLFFGEDHLREVAAFWRRWRSTRP